MGNWISYLARRVERMISERSGLTQIETQSPLVFDRWTLLWQVGRLLLNSKPVVNRLPQRTRLGLYPNKDSHWVEGRASTESDGGKRKVVSSAERRKRQEKRKRSKSYLEAIGSPESHSFPFPFELTAFESDRIEIEL